MRRRDFFSVHDVNPFMVYNPIIARITYLVLTRMKIRRTLSKKIFSRIPPKKYRIWLPVSVIVPAFLLFVFLTSSHTEETVSPEVGFTSVSPAGEPGGIVVPASCASNLHDDPWYGAACSACNVCGACSNGSYQCSGTPEFGAWDWGTWWGERFMNALGLSWAWLGVINPLGSPGACSVGAPALPVGYGNACVSAANNCGSTNSGAIDCSGGCNAVAPADIPLGTACQGPANACGMRTPGVITCSGCDSTVAPPNALCDLAVCKNSCVSTLDRTGSFTVASGPPATTLKACFYQAGTSACASGVDVTGSATWTETNAPKDTMYFSPAGVLNARYVNGDEVFNVSYLGVNKSPQVTVVCIPNTCSIAPANVVTDTYCPEVTQDTGVPTGCDGMTLVCPGTRKCNYNWRETAP